MTNSYYFITRWRVKASAEEVFAIISEPLEFPRWWPAVYLEAQDLGDRRVRFHTRGWLPYTLWFETAVIDSVNTIFVQTLMASGQAWLRLLSNGVWAALVLVSSLLLVPTHGALGLAMALCAAQSIHL